LMNFGLEYELKCIVARGASQPLEPFVA
jgi:hypothetical protein